MNESQLLTIMLNHREVTIPTDDEWFKYIKYSWNGAYTIVRPSQQTDTWKAFAMWGDGDELIADTPGHLLDLIHHHYGPDTNGYVDMLIARLEEGKHHARL